MFTGIIEELGTLAAIEQRGEGARLRIHCHTVLSGSFEGASIAVNGVCLTALRLTGDSFDADIAPETMRRTSLGGLAPGARVNLERPVPAEGRLGGHVVQGHVDGTGVLEGLDELGNGNWWLRVRVPAELDRYIVEKGSIAIDGISLTVASIQNRLLGVTIIPHTFQNTSLGAQAPGARVNLETDILAKYVEKLLQKQG
ncbi:MAG: riboflavin synthase [Acidobacteria bacterium]|nr:riboflavin synthase [Acidobacteriota bacterium]